MNNNEIRKELETLSEEKYRRFAENLKSGSGNVLGVRMPKLRALAKKIFESTDIDAYLSEASDDSFEEIMLQGMVIGLDKKHPGETLTRIEGFLPKINTWALCDSFVSGLKTVKKHQDMFWPITTVSAESDDPWRVRFGLVMMLYYYVDDEHIDEVFRHIDAVDTEDYYVMMAAAWAVSECYLKKPEKTMAYLKDNRLDDRTFNKAVQKIRESRRVSDDEKEMLKQMKR